MSVSYTHLDVYKRQAQDRSQNSGQEGKINESVASNQSAKEDESTKPDNGEERKSIKSEYYKDRPSKSYQSVATPEDVYKRQVLY